MSYDERSPSHPWGTAAARCGSGRFGPGDLLASRHAARTLSIAWVVLLLGVLAVGWLLTHPLESTIDPWDDSISRWIAEDRTPDGEFLAAGGSHVADTIVGVIVAAVAALVLWRKEHSWRPVVYFTVLVVGTLVLYLIVTFFITRDRPPVKILDPGLVPDHSYPSGHVATSIVVYCALAIYLFRTVAGRSAGRGSSSSRRSSSRHRGSTRAPTTSPTW